MIDLSRAGGKAIDLIGVRRVSLYQVEPNRTVALAEPKAFQAPVDRDVATRMVAAPSRDRPRSYRSARSGPSVKVSQVARITRSPPRGMAKPAKPKAAKVGTRAGRPSMARYRLHHARPGALRVRSSPLAAGAQSQCGGSPC